MFIESLAGIEKTRVLEVTQVRSRRLLQNQNPTLKELMMAMERNILDVTSANSLSRDMRSAADLLSKAGIKQAFVLPAAEIRSVAPATAVLPVKEPLRLPVVKAAQQHHLVELVQSIYVQMDADPTEVYPQAISSEINGTTQVYQETAEFNDEFMEQFYNPYAHKIRGYLRRMLGNDDEADQLTQETFLKAYTGIGKIKGELKIGPWLYKIAQNLIRDESRRKKLIHFEVLDSSPRAYLVKSENRLPEEIFLAKEDQIKVREVIAKLPPHYQAALVLLIWKQMPCEEIGKIIGCSKSAVKSLLFRARALFREVYLKDNHGQVPLLT